jgi:Zn-finger nucleic acid-binding protein
MAYREPARDLACPRCGVRLEAHQRLRACTTCGGLWVPSAELGRILDEGPRHWMWWRRPELRCPTCDRGMALVRIGDKLVDRCKDHGIWFDRGEHDEAIAAAAPEPPPPPPPPPAPEPPPRPAGGPFDLGALTEQIHVVAIYGPAQVGDAEAFETAVDLAWHVRSVRALGPAEVTELLGLWAAFEGTTPRATVHWPSLGLQITAGGVTTARIALDLDNGTASVRTRRSDHFRRFDPQAPAVAALRALLGRPVRTAGS